MGKSTSKIQLIELRPTNDHKKPASTKPPTISSTIATSVVTFTQETSEFWSTSAFSTSETTTTSGLFETIQNETVIRISLNRDNSKADDYDPMLDGKRLLISSFFY